jgi:hypothetical protein
MTLFLYNLHQEHLKVKRLENQIVKMSLGDRQNKGPKQDGQNWLWVPMYEGD